MSWKLKLLPHVWGLYKAFTSNDVGLILKALNRSPIRVTVDGSVVAWDEIIPYYDKIRASNAYDMIDAVRRSDSLAASTNKDEIRKFFQTDDLSLVQDFYRPGNLFRSVENIVSSLGDNV